MAKKDEAAGAAEDQNTEDQVSEDQAAEDQDAEDQQAGAEEEGEDDFGDEFDRIAAGGDPTKPDDDPRETKGDAEASEGDDDDAGGDDAGDDDAAGDKAAAGADDGDGEKDVEKSADTKDSVEDRLAALAKKVDDQAQYIRSSEGRWKSSQRDAAKLRDEVAANKKAASSAGENADDGAGADPLKEARDEYPEIVKPLEAVLKVKDDQIEDLKTKVNKLEGTSAKDALAREQGLLTEANPNWLTSIKHEGFEGWLNKQPQYIQDVVARNEDGIVDHVEAGDVIGRFEIDAEITYADDADEPSDDDDGDAASEDKAKLAGKRDLQKKSANAPKSKSRGSSAGGPPEDYDGAFDHFAKQADKAEKDARA